MNMQPNMKNYNTTSNNKHNYSKICNNTHNKSNN